MKIINFFITKIFLKRWILSLCIIALLFLINFLTFTAARSIISTYQGFEEIKVLNKPGIFVANLDPKSNADMSNIKLDDTKKLFDFLNNNYSYALQADGFVTSLDNDNDMEVTVNYLNEEAYKLRDINLLNGKNLNFDYNQKKDKIPVLIGYGLAKKYPLNSTIKVIDPASQKQLTLKVQGVLKKNTFSSNFYAPNSKNYFNFSIFFPINKEFLQNSNLDLQVNGLMDLILLNTTKEKTEIVSQFIENNLGLKFNFFKQQENFDYFKDYYIYSLQLMGIVTSILLIIIISLTVWAMLSSLRLMIKDFTINRLIGLNYLTLRKIFYFYFGILFFINIVILFILTAYNRYSFWLNKEALYATYGILGLIPIDWIALIVVIIVDLIVGLIIVEIIIKKIKSIPISLGVLQ